jgi:hypothetical protein
MKTFKTTILLIFVCAIGIAQNDSLQIKELFSKSQKFYESKTAYQMELEYVMYKSSTENEQLEYYKSRVIKNGNDFYTKIHNTEFIEVASKSLKINHDEHAVLLAKREFKVNSIGVIDNILKLLPKFKSYSVVETNEGFRCQFIAHEVTQLPFAKAIISFNKDYSLKKQVLYLSNALPYVENNKNVFKSPRLEINVSGVKDYVVDEKLKLSTYLKNNNKNLLSDKFSKYQLISNL